MHPWAASAAPHPDWRLAVVLMGLVGLAVVTSYVGRLGVGRDHVTARPGPWSSSH